MYILLCTVGWEGGGILIIHRILPSLRSRLDLRATQTKYRGKPKLLIWKYTNFHICFEKIFVYQKISIDQEHFVIVINVHFVNVYTY